MKEEIIIKENVFDIENEVCIISKSEAGWYKVSFDYIFNDGSRISEEDDVDIDVDSIETLDRAMKMAEFMKMHLKRTLKQLKQNKEFQ